MSIEKSIKRFQLRLLEHDNLGNVKGIKKSFYPNLDDVKALNAIIDYKEQQESYSLSQNESLAKLWIHQLMLLNMSKLYSSDRAIQVIDEILEQPLSQWVEKLHENVCLMQINSECGKVDGYLEAIRDANFTKINELQLSDDKVLNALKTEVKKDNIYKFVANQINRIINKFEK